MDLSLPEEGLLDLQLRRITAAAEDFAALLLAPLPPGFIFQVPAVVVVGQQQQLVSGVVSGILDFRISSPASLLLDVHAFDVVFSVVVFFLRRKVDVLGHEHCLGGWCHLDLRVVDIFLFLLGSSSLLAGLGQDGTGHEAALAAVLARQALGVRVVLEHLLPFVLEVWRVLLLLELHLDLLVQNLNFVVRWCQLEGLRRVLQGVT
mmetsp:Transcript_34637/g.52974  ORF Transcript_34637/g.52974 Transcript_34637/m.52974 type:complete len:205 (-) Transcript_34637:1198-1812(-)